MLKRFAIPIAICSYVFLIFFRINSVRLFVSDEMIYAGSVQNMVFQGLDGNNHPLLAKTIWLIFVKLGWIIFAHDYPVFWRFGTILLTFGCLVVFYKICRLFFVRRIALLGTAILAIDPMFFVFGRSLLLEVPSLFFFLLAVYGLLIFQIKAKLSYLYVSAFSLGLSFAAKISPLLSFVVLQIVNALDLKSLSKIIVAITVVILTIASGFTLGNSFYFTYKKPPENFVNYTLTLVSTFLTGKYHGPSLFTVEMSPPASWYILPQATHGFMQDRADGIMAVFPFQNPLTAFLILPSLAFLVWKWKRLSPPQKTIIYTFLIVYGIYFIKIRETYYYYIVQLIPFVILIELFALQHLLVNPSRINRWLKYTFWASLVVFGLFYPILTGFPTPKPYEQLLNQYFNYHPIHRTAVNCEDC